MQAHSQDPSIGSMAPLQAGDSHKAAHLLYQWATILAILLFLISFWSC